MADAWRVPDSAETPLTPTLCYAPSPYPYNIYLPIGLKFLPCGFTALVFQSLNILCNPLVLEEAKTVTESERSPGALLKGTSCRLHWDQPQGHRESKALLTRCALYQREPPRDKEPGPRLKFHQKVEAWSGVPCTSNPCLKSAAALALSSGLVAPRPEGALALPADVRLAPPCYSVSWRGPTGGRGSLYQDEVLSIFYRARLHYTPTLLRRGRIAGFLHAFPPKFLLLPPSLPLL